MKTKSSLLAILMFGLVFSMQRASAQTDQTAPVTVNIDLTAAVLSIDLGPNPTVNFVYGTAAAYTISQTQAKPAHFTVISNQSYDITVEAVTEFNTSPTNLTPVPLDVIDISVDPATANGGTLTTQPLTLGPLEIVSAAAPTTGAVYNVNYTIPDATPLLGKAPIVYTTTVIYTATQL